MPKSHNTPVYQAFIKAEPNYSIGYVTRIDGGKKTRIVHAPKHNKHGKVISRKSGYKLRSAFHWLMASSTIKKVYQKETKKWFSFKINFITLTLSSLQVHSDQFIKQHLLEPFLKWMSRKYGSNTYIWKAEVQSNGNIHFHITTNVFVHWKAIRLKWNRLQFNHGYFVNSKFENPIEEANSTDVHSVKNQGTIINYLVKYFSKSDSRKKTCSLYVDTNQSNMMLHNYDWEMEPDGAWYELKRPVQCKLWSCSHHLTNASIRIEAGYKAFEDYQSFLSNNPDITKTELERCLLFTYSPTVINSMPSDVRLAFKEQIKRIREFSNQQNVTV